MALKGGHALKPYKSKGNSYKPSLSDAQYPRRTGRACTLQTTPTAIAELSSRVAQGV